MRIKGKNQIRVRGNGEFSLVRKIIILVKLRKIA